MQQVSLTSKLRAPASDVFRHASSLAGVNEELWPLHMSGPGNARFDAFTPLGRRLFRSRLTLFRVLPVDLHDLRLVQVHEGRGFHEDSTSLLERRWVHVRTIEPAPDGGCTIHDEVSFEPKLLPGLVRRFVQRVFERRHAVLRRKFGAG